MKSTIAIILLSIFWSKPANTQILKKISEATTKNSSSLTTDEIALGLKEALNVGVHKSVAQLSNLDGFLKNEAIKIVMPPEAQRVEQTLRNLGLNKLVDDAIVSMNRAAEDAAKSAAPIFLDAIRGINFQDALNILRGGDFAATNYLKDKTTSALTQSFEPIIKSSLDKVNATEHWEKLFTAYNKVSLKKVNPNLTAYVTERALNGLFHQIALEEKSIRKDPLQRSSDLLKKVFSTQ